MHVDYVLCCHVLYDGSYNSDAHFSITLARNADNFAQSIITDIMIVIPSLFCKDV